MALAIKKQIYKSLRGYGLAGAVDDDALTCMTTFLQQEGKAEQLQPLLLRCQADRPVSGAITRPVVEAAIAQLQGKGQGLELVAVVNAFDVPKISYDAVGRKMFADPAPRTLFGNAMAKHKLYLDRLQLVTQRMRRNKLFQPSQYLSGEGPKPQLTDLQSLRGMIGECRFVMGCVARGEDGRRLVLEDASGSVPLDISTAQWPSGFFTENCVVIAQGVMARDGVFYAQQLGLPPVEKREDLAEASKRLNFFGGPVLGPDELKQLVEEEEQGGHMEDRMVVCANVWLDQPATFQRLSKLLTAFEGVAIVPPVFVLMGNFHSKAPAVAGSLSASQRTGGATGTGVDLLSLREGFNTLARLIDTFPRIKLESRFVFVPGPGDPSPSDALPQPPLPAFFQQDILRVLPNALFTSNPCRIRYLSREVVLFRYDILKRLRRRCLLPISNIGAVPDATGNTQHETAQRAARLWKHLTVTLLQQSHLCPLPLLHQPIYWQYDHALQLYPLPHAVVVADMSPQAHHTHEGCCVFTPGSFADGCFAAYVPCQQVVELSLVPGDGGAASQEDYSMLSEQEEDGAAVDDTSPEQQLQYAAVDSQAVDSEAGDGRLGDDMQGRDQEQNAEVLTGHALQGTVKGVAGSSMGDEVMQDQQAADLSSEHHQGMESGDVVGQPGDAYYDTLVYGMGKQAVA